MSGKMCSEFGLARCYTITIEGKIDISWSDWLGSLKLSQEQDSDGSQVTILRGILPDQSALRGLLNRLWDLNLVVCSVTQINHSKKRKEVI